MNVLRIKVKKSEDGIEIDGFLWNKTREKNNINDDLTHRHSYGPTSFVSSLSTAKFGEANYIEWL